MDSEHSSIGDGAFILRGIVMVNLLLIGLLWIPAIGGTENQSGLADRLLERFRMGGFRPDFLWLILSSGLIFLAIFFPGEAEARESNRTTLLLCILEVLAFCGFMVHSMLAGNIDFG